MKLRRGDLVPGLAAILLSIGWLQLAGRIPDSLLSDSVGAAGLPRAVGWALGVVGVLLCVRAVQRAQPQGQPAAPQDPRELLQPHLRALGLLAILFGSVLLAPWLGYAITTVLLVAAGAWYAGAPRNRYLAIVPLLAGLALWLLFVHAFGIAMPGGALFGGR